MKSIFHLSILSAALTWSASSTSQAAIIVQELFDNAPNDTQVSGHGNYSNSIGMTGTWLTNVSGDSLKTGNGNVNGSTLPGLPSSTGGAGGQVWNNSTNWNTAIYSTRALTTTISFADDREIFFSVRLLDNGDDALGIGLASGANGSAEFVGAGISWNTVTGGNANAAYITHGTLNGGSGVYGQAAAEAAGSVTQYSLLVGRITLSSIGSDLIDIKRYAANTTIDDDLSSITWSAQSSVDSSMDASHMLIWLNGQIWQGELDAVRVGDTWKDVTGVTLVPEPSAALLGGLGLLGLLRRRRG